MPEHLVNNEADTHDVNLGGCSHQQSRPILSSVDDWSVHMMPDQRQPDRDT